MIPTEFGDLANLEILWVLNNELTGPLPRDLLRLTELRWIRWDGNRSLCAPGTPGFVKWLETKVSRGSFCNESDQATLNSLYEAVGGEDWTQSAGWQGDAALSEWYGVDADSLGHVGYAGSEFRTGSPESFRAAWATWRISPSSALAETNFRAPCPSP